ncbi:helix-turn-helix domain-containing protein [Nocardioides sp. GCM10027113]|uniref:helix-turn-helix domain-containing protein n=1 Tax=unclassified Nocardioides TaxID=2615069 RepID=UPI00361B55D8
MPRPNPTRPIGREVVLARRIAYEREARGWTYENLAAHMSRAGCPINPSALYKIEKNDPPRRITVDEFFALSRVFGVSLTSLARPPEEVASKEFERLLEEASRSLEAMNNAMDDHYAAVREGVLFLDKHRELIEDTSLAAQLGWLEAAWSALVPDKRMHSYFEERLVDRARGKM